MVGSRLLNQSSDMAGSGGLKERLSEWMQRVEAASPAEFGNRLQRLLDHLRDDRILCSILSDACTLHALTPEEIEQRWEEHGNSAPGTFINSTEEAAFWYQVILWMAGQAGGVAGIRNRGDIAAPGTTYVIETFLHPIVQYLLDRLEEAGPVVYLLERYRKRTEWFMRKRLVELYRSDDGGGEEALKQDLLLFLFDQGVDYPFTEAQSPSGRVDVVGLLDTSDPLVLEVKVLDKSKNYGKARIREGLSQVIKYASDYGKDIGYLVVFNLEKLEVDFRLGDSAKAYPPLLIHGNKRFYFVVVSLADMSAASKIGQTEVLSITSEFLLNDAVSA